MISWILALALATSDGGAPARDGGTPARAAGTSAPDGGTTGVLSQKSLRQKIHITAQKMEIHGKGNELVWTGDVHADRGTTKLTCDRLVAHYTSDQEVSEIECLGSVEIVDGDRWAKGERAEFDNVRGILVVTGKPEARQGRNRMRGSKVTFYMERDLIEVKDPDVTVHGTKLRGSGKPR